MKMQDTQEGRDIYAKIMKASKALDQEIEELPEVVEHLYEYQRNSYGMSLKEFAGILGCNPSTYISNYKPINNLAIFARFCGIFGYEFKKVLPHCKTLDLQENAFNSTAAALQSLDCSAIEQMRDFVQNDLKGLSNKQKRELLDGLNGCIKSRQSVLKWND